jgi:hypothetical protein
MEKNNFILYKDYEEHVALLSNEEAGKLFKAIFRYVDGRKELELDGMTKMAFSFIKRNLERDLIKYKDKCNLNALNGAKGGRPKGSIKNPTVIKNTERLNNKPKKADIGIDIDTDTVIDIDNDSDIKTNNKIKERHLDFVFLTKEEYLKLISKFGLQDADRKIDKLNSYIGSKGKKYKSHYHTILNWANKEKKEHPNNINDLEFDKEGNLIE